MADLALRGVINRGRATLGLEAIASPIRQLLEGRTILAADRDLAPLPDDAPKSAVSTDAWVLNEPGTLDHRVEAFLQRVPEVMRGDHPGAVPGALPAGRLLRFHCRLVQRP